MTSGITSAPSTAIGRLDRLRSATCSTARCSVLLILPPVNIASIAPARPVLPRQGHQQLHGLAGNAILRVIEQDVAKAQREAVEAAGVGGEQLAQVEALEGAPVRGQIPPRRQLDQR